MTMVCCIIPCGDAGIIIIGSWAGGGGAMAWFSATLLCSKYCWTSAGTAAGGGGGTTPPSTFFLPSLSPAFLTIKSAILSKSASLIILLPFPSLNLTNLGASLSGNLPPITDGSELCLVLSGR